MINASFAEVASFSCRWLICTVLVVIALNEVAAQRPGVPATVPSQDEVEQLIDGSLDDESAEAGDLERISELRAFYLQNPLDLNEVTVEQFAALNLLSPAQAQAIVRRRAQAGDYLSELELQAVPGLTTDDVRALMPFVEVASGSSAVVDKLKARIKDAVGFAAFRSGYQTTSANVDNWLGPRLPIYLRVRATAGRQFSIGVVAENDAGEQYGGSNNPLLFDYVSAHAYADELPGFIKTVALGDYGVNWGQGLISYTGFGTGKSALVMNVQRNGRWLIPHASVREVGFFRGAAAVAKRGPWKAMAMASRTRPDGALDTLDPLIDDVAFGTFRLGGFHRTANEVAGRRANTATSFGGALSYEKRWGRLSIHYLEHNFEVPFGQKDQLYQRFDFTGDRLQNASLAWQTFLGPLTWFGEAAVDGRDATAILTGIQMGLDRRTDVAIVARRYDAAYRTLYNNVFGTSRRPENEEGVYLSIRSQLKPEWVAQGFVDVYTHPFARFRLSRPSTQYDGLFRLTYDKRRKHQVYAQLRHRVAERDLGRSESPTLRTVEPYVRTSLRVQGRLAYSKSLTFRTRVEFARTQEQGEVFTGTVVYQDILLKPLGSRFSATGRIALIDTDDYSSRIYAFENDLLYRFRIPAYYGQGYRTYLNLRFRASPDFTAELRGAFGRRAGSDDQVEVAGQLRYRF